MKTRKMAFKNSVREAELALSKWVSLVSDSYLIEILNQIIDNVGNQNISSNQTRDKLVKYFDRIITEANKTRATILNVDGESDDVKSTKVDELNYLDLVDEFEVKLAKYFSDLNQAISNFKAELDTGDIESMYDVIEALKDAAG